METPTIKTQPELSCKFEFQEAKEEIRYEFVEPEDAAAVDNVTNSTAKKATTKRKLLYCDMCNYSNVKRCSLLLHLIRNHTDGDGKETILYPFCCDVCGRRYINRSNLSAHMRYHTGERPYACTVDGCDRRFATSTERNTHVLAELGERPFKCDECPDKFTTKQTLNKHKINKHSDFRKYNCEQCGKSFKTLTSYRTHHMTHSRVVKFTCEFCGRMFSRRDAFNVHMNVHTDNRPHKCRVCDRGFHSTPARISHEKNVHKI